MTAAKAPTNGAIPKYAPVRALPSLRNANTKTQCLPRSRQTQPAMQSQPMSVAATILLSTMPARDLRVRPPGL
jgi:hypothetical protein